MDESSAYNPVSPVVTDFPRYQGTSTPPAREYQPERQPFRLPPINIVLFLLTLLTTTMAGADMAGAFVTMALPFQQAWSIWRRACRFRSR